MNFLLCDVGAQKLIDQALGLAEAKVQLERAVVVRIEEIHIGNYSAAMSGRPK